MKLELPRLYGAGSAVCVSPSGRAEGPRSRGSGAKPEGGAKRPCPPALTGGESPPLIKRNTQRSKVDWLTFTFKTDPELDHALEHLDLLRSVLGPNVTAVDCAGMLGYEHGIRYFARVEDEEIAIARLDWGGNHHKQRGRFDLSGTGCSKVGNWHKVAEFIGHQFAYTLTRIDLACDLLDGAYTVEHCVDWYRAGEFNAGGRNPRHSLVGDWLDPHHGRTFEVGRRTNGKMLRAYEKGRQLGDADSAWTRFEVEFRNIDRDLTLDMLLSPDQYFAGAYACLARLLDVAGEKVPTHQREGEISLEHLIQHARTAYGKCIHVMRLHMSAQDVIDSLTINGVPARLEKAAVGGFLSSLSQAQLE